MECHGRGLSPCWGCHTVLGPLCPCLWHLVLCAMAGFSHCARGYHRCHTVSEVTMHWDMCLNMCAMCTALCPGCAMPYVLCHNVPNLARAPCAHVGDTACIEMFRGGV